MAEASSWMGPDPDVNSCSLLLNRNIFAPLVTNHSVSLTHMQAHMYIRTAAPGIEADKQTSHFNCDQIEGESD